MKLWTSLTASCDGSLVDAADENLIHDAMAAHALMQAMSEIEGTYADCAPACDVRQFLHERAGELMREWGFDSGEVGGE